MNARRGDLPARRREKRRDSRRRLLDAAHTLLEARPWADVSLDEITTMAELSRTAFYRHFEDRQELLMAMLDDVGLELSHVAENWMTGAKDPVTELERSVSGLTAIFVEHGRLLRAIADTATHDPDIDRLYNGLGDQLVEATARRIEQDVEAGISYVRDPREVAEALTWMNERYLLVSFGRRPFADPTAVARGLTTVWVNTVYGTPPQPPAAA